MRAALEMLLKEREERMKLEEDNALKQEDHGDCKGKKKQLGGGDEPPKSPSSTTPPPPSSSTHSLSSNPFKGVNKPKIKLDVKFELPKYCGELDAEKLDDWIQQVEVYCIVQNLFDDASRIQIATLRLGGSTLTWWESRNRVEILQHGRVNLSWSKFVSALKSSFIP